MSSAANQLDFNNQPKHLTIKTFESWKPLKHCFRSPPPSPPMRNCAFWSHPWTPDTAHAAPICILRPGGWLWVFVPFPGLFVLFIYFPFNSYYCVAAHIVLLGDQCYQAVPLPWGLCLIWNSVWANGFCTNLQPHECRVFKQNITQLPDNPFFSLSVVLMLQLTSVAAISFNNNKLKSLFNFDAMFCISSLWGLLC